MIRFLMLGVMLLMANGIQAQDYRTSVYVNDVELSINQVQILEQAYRVKVQKGRYWYDPVCGLWGMQSGPALGLMMAGMQLGGPLKANASNGRTGIFINGRQLDRAETLQWKQLLGAVYQGRYWLDAYGNLGLESGGYLLNVVQVANTYRGGSRNSFYRNNYTDTGSGSSSEGFYIMGKDWSYSSF